MSSIIKKKNKTRDKELDFQAKGLIGIFQTRCSAEDEPEHIQHNQFGLNKERRTSLLCSGPSKEYSKRQERNKTTEPKADDPKLQTNSSIIGDMYILPSMTNSTTLMPHNDGSKEKSTKCLTDQTNFDTATSQINRSNKEEIKEKRYKIEKTSYCLKKPQINCLKDNTKSDKGIPNCFNCTKEETTCCGVDKTECINSARKFKTNNTRMSSVKASERIETKSDLETQNNSSTLQKINKKTTSGKEIKTFATNSYHFSKPSCSKMDIPEADGSKCGPKTEINPTESDDEIPQYYCNEENKKNYGKDTKCREVKKDLTLEKNTDTTCENIKEVKQDQAVLNVETCYEAVQTCSNDIERQISAEDGARRIDFRTEIRDMRVIGSQIHKGITVIVISDDHFSQESETYEANRRQNPFCNSEVAFVLGYGLLILTITSVIVAIYKFPEKSTGG